MRAVADIFSLSQREKNLNNNLSFASDVWCKKMAEMESSVSISITSAIVYVVSGLVFFLLVFLLVMMGVTNCNWECEGG